MIWWWIKQPHRAKAEKDSIAELEESSEWLQRVRWRTGEDLRLEADFDLIVGGTVTPLTIAYPEFFPDLPAMILSRDGVRLSEHQYGASGELCLEYRADNWDPSYTGAMLIESAFRLIAGERGADGERAEVPSDHRSTEGQLLRFVKLRFVISQTALEALLSIPEGCPLPASFIRRSYAGAVVAQLERIGTEENPEWSTSITDSDASRRSATVLRLPDHLTSSDPIGFEELLGFTEGQKFDEFRERLQGDDLEYVVLVGNDWVRLVFVVTSEKTGRTVSDYETVLVPDTASRLPESYATLMAAHVGIVGCGSVGSKIASMLVRSGVGNFVLVDDDVLFPGNLVRNELDGRAVGIHKTEALEVRLREINPDVAVITHRVRLGGQESAAGSSLAMERLAKCDLIVDATANMISFRLIGAVARTYEKPMIWMEVFAGGIGGIVARCRPGSEPAPHIARAQLDRWCEQHDVTIPKVATPGGYDGTAADGTPLVADDADVTVIAAHAARMAIDTLARPGETAFPHPAYAVGLKEHWIFRAPHDVWPIDFGAPEGWGAPTEPGGEAVLVELLNELFAPEKSDEAASTV